MSWQQPAGQHYDPNAAPFIPGGQQAQQAPPQQGGGAYYPNAYNNPAMGGGGYYPPQQQMPQGAGGYGAGGGGAYYPPQQQQQGGGYYPNYMPSQPQQQPQQYGRGGRGGGGFNPNAGAYVPQQMQRGGGYGRGGGYNNYNNNMMAAPNAGGNSPAPASNEAAGYGAGAPPAPVVMGGGANAGRPYGGASPQQSAPAPAGGRGTGKSASPPQQQQQKQQQQASFGSPAPAATSSADNAKLSLGGSTPTPPATTPGKKKAGTLSLGKKKQQQQESGAGKAAEGEEPADKAASRDTTASPESPASPASEGAADKGKAKMTQEELRESVKAEIARQREQNKKEFVRDPRPHFNVVFCGHVDAGKSTISGHLLMEKGLVDQREMDKLRREAEIHHREGWEYAYVMDVSEEERSKGITRETGAAYLETEKRRMTVLDAPGHKAFVPSMIGGATQADVCVLVISSRTGEFETGFEKGGQTREHAMLVRTCGVKQMICVINKMDEMQWSKDRYDEIVGKLRPFLKQNGYDEEKAKNLIFMPVAGLTGGNLIKHTTEEECPWYTGPTMMGVIDELVLPESKSEEDVLCIPLVGAYKDDGKNYIYGKVESGSIAVGEKLQLLPTKQEGVVEAISIESTEFEKCYPGDNVHLRMRGIDENDVHSGYVATSVPTSLRAVEFFQARVVILEVKNVISAGSKFMLHVHAAQEEASFHKLLAKLDKRTGDVVEKNPACARAGDVVIARIELERPVVLETHKDFDKMGRFMMRDEGKTIAIGLVTKLYESTHESLTKGGLN